jgi:hypothetical protein
MIATKKYIRELREKHFVRISKIAEKIILETLGQEPEPDEDGPVYIYTEQDIWEQTRKIIQENPEEKMPFPY